MIFIRALLTTVIRQCRVKALKTELAIACLYKAVANAILDAPKCSQLIVNEIHNR